VSATLAPAAVERVCVSCGALFSDVRRSGAPRSYCDDCRSSRNGKQAEVLAPAEPLPGRPFTLRHFRAWCSRLRLRNGEQFELEEWEARFVSDVFAGYRECWLVVPEGNGKSTLVSILLAYFCEFLPEACIPVAASARDQAEIIFQLVKGFVRRSPALQGRFVCKPGKREVVVGDSFAKIYASDADTGDGIIPVGLEIIDELHRHKTLELYRTWAGKLDKEDAQLIVISTAGEPGGDFEQTRAAMREAATEVKRDGCFGRYASETFVLHEYAVPDDGDVEDLELVKAANPSSRITIETLAAKRSRPSWTLAHWRRLTCNVPTRDRHAAISEAEWSRARTDERIPDGAEVWLGIDWGFKRDTTAIVPLWWRSDAERILGEASIFEPPRDGSSLHPDVVKAKIRELAQRYRVTTVVMDMTHATDVAHWTSDELDVVVVDRAQSAKPQTEDYERFMAALRNGHLRHTGDPGLRRHVLNAVVKLTDDGRARFVRPIESRLGPNQAVRVIDALIAAAMVHSVAVEQRTAMPAKATWRAL
jgi:phage terminase large subunit-like protein